jgi:hypothetical protein
LYRRCRTLGLAALTAAWWPPAPAVAQAPPRECGALSYDTLAAWASRAPKRENLSGGYRVLPGGATARLEIPAGAPPDHRWCAGLQRVHRPIRILSAAARGPADSTVTTLTVGIPDYGFGWYRASELVLVAFGADSATGGVVPSVSVMTLMRVSNSSLAWMVGLLVVGITYVLAVLTIGELRRIRSWDPVRLTVGASGQASLSQFQIFAFTLIVVLLLTRVLARVGLLSDISSDLLLLLGISAGGAAGSKVAGVMKKRLSFESWSWLRNAGWLTAYERGAGSGAAPPKVRWSDLLKTGGEFDVYSFQLATVSLVVALALLSADLTELATFDLPDNILALLGLSNVVYIGGKAVTPNSVAELDEKIAKVRELEKTWRSAVPLGTSLADAKALAQSAYEDYRTAALEAARMVKSLYGKDGTSFHTEPITEDQVLPTLG